MAYPPNQVPDAPMPVSMMVQADTLTVADLFYLVQPNNDPGEKSRKVTLLQILQAVGSNLMPAGTIPGSKLQAASISNTELGARCVKTNNIDLKAVTQACIGDGAVGALQIANLSIFARHVSPELKSQNLGGVTPSGGSWGGTQDDILVATIPALTGQQVARLRIVDFTFECHLTIPGTSDTTRRRLDLIVEYTKNGTTFLKNRVPIYFQIGDVIAKRAVVTALDSYDVKVYIGLPENPSSYVVPSTLLVDEPYFCGTRSTAALL